MENIVETTQFQAQKFLDIALGWLLSPQAWCQFGLLIAAFFAAYFLSKLLSPRLRSWLMFPETRPNVIIEAAKFLIVFLPLLLPLVAYAFTAAGEVVGSSILGSSEVIAFGDSGVEFAVGFWVNGLDDGSDKFTSDVLFIIWNALKENNIEIPYPQRVVEIKGDLPKLTS